MAPALIENFIIFEIVVCQLFANNIIMIGEPMHTAFEMAPHAPAISSEK